MHSSGSPMTSRSAAEETSEPSGSQSFRRVNSHASSLHFSQIQRVVPLRTGTTPCVVGLYGLDGLREDRQLLRHFTALLLVLSDELTGLLRKARDGRLARHDRQMGLVDLGRHIVADR